MENTKKNERMKENGKADIAMKTEGREEEREDRQQWKNEENRKREYIKRMGRNLY